MKNIFLNTCTCLFFLVHIGSGFAQEAQKPVMIKLPFAFSQANRVPMENTPVLFNSRLLMVANFRPSGGAVNVKPGDSYLYIDDLVTGEEILRFGTAHSFASAFVNDSELNVFALDISEPDGVKKLSGINRFVTSDLKNWKIEKVILPEGGEGLYNTSVCRDDKGYLMAYESNKPIQFCFKFARSTDLLHWNKIPGLVFTGVQNEYSACPVIRYFKPYYYVIYLHNKMAGHNGYTSFMGRSKKLMDWELSPFNPILEAEEGEGLNNSDVDILEYKGKTYLYYATGDQETWATIRIAMYDGLMKTFYEKHFPEGVKFEKISARQKPG